MRRVAGDDQTAAWFLCLSGKCGLHRRRCLDQVNAYAQDAAEPWLDASAWQARGLARRRTADAFRDLQQAAIRFAAAGDLMHTSIVRYMLAHRAVEDGERLDEEPVWRADEHRGPDRMPCGASPYPCAQRSHRRWLLRE